MNERIQQVIEALGRYEPCDEDGSVCVANRLAVEEARAMLGEYAAEVARLREALADIAADNPSVWGKDQPCQFKVWAQNRARFTLDAARAAP